MTWLVKLFRGWVFDLATSWIARKLREDKALIYALKDYQAGAPFLTLVRGYTFNTETPDDDRVMADIDRLQADLKERPFKEVLPGLLRGIKLPDFDGDPDDDIAVTEAIDRIIEEATK